MQSDPGYADEVRMDPADFSPKKDIKGKAKETEAMNLKNGQKELLLMNMQLNQEMTEDRKAKMKSIYKIYRWIQTQAKIQNYKQRSKREKKNLE